MHSLNGRTALVTGSGRNIGRAIALEFAKVGANVVVNGARNADQVDSVVEEIRAAGGRALGVMADVSDPEAVTAMVAAAAAHFGSVDIAVSNVGRRLHQPFLQISVEDWQAVLNTNLSALFYLDRAVLPQMQARCWGRLIHISGYDGFTGHLLNRAHNVACKAGMHGLTKAIAREFGPFGITCNTVVPGAINTERDWSQYPNTNVEQVAQRIAVRRWGEVADIAAACLYLAGDAAGFVTGQALHVNGGEHMF
jgi:NAD(P)-dependent dehydrogenase (short-subunit alcohol dehydrogenase family)